MKEKEVLLIIDPQNDFVTPGGSLFIPEADSNVTKICELIETRNPSKIIITQDTHQAYHIGHSCWWKENPAPFTQITYDDVIKGTYSPRISSNKRELVSYLNRLPGKVHTIWPEHCLEGSWGWALPNKLIKALSTWQLKNQGRKYEIIQKGTSQNHEMYSAITRADNTSIKILKYNTFIKKLTSYDKVLVTGFAKDVCVAWTVKDLHDSKYFKDKLVFIDSCMGCLDTEAETLKIYDTAVKEGGAVWE